MYLLGVDIGSSSLKCVVFDELGNLITSIKTNYNIIENGDFVEQDPHDYYNAFIKNLKQIDKETLSKIEVLCVCGQAPTDIFVDKNGIVLRNAIMWKDRRAKKQLERQKKAYTFTQLENFAGCPIPKTENWTPLRMAWVKDNEPEIANNIYKVLQPKDYLIYRLSNEFVTDFWSARTFVNINTGVINEELLSFYGYNKNVLPKIYKPTDVCATLNNEEVASLGLGNNLKIVCGCSDGFASVLSAGVFSKGNVAFNSTGTSEIAGVVKQNDKSFEGLHIFPKSLTNEKGVIFGPTQSGGSSLIWLAKNLLNVSFDEMISLAGKSPAGSNGIVFLPYISGERAPIWDSNAKGSFFGVKSSHTASDFARSVLEGVAFSIRNIMESSNQSIDELRILGGGSKIPLWCQIRADVLNANVNVIDCDEACAQGATILAGVGIGLYKSFADATEKVCKISKTYNPNKETESVYNKNYYVYKTLYENTKDLMKEM